MSSLHAHAVLFVMAGGVNVKQLGGGVECDVLEFPRVPKICSKAVVLEEI